MRIALGSDHAGFALKEALKASLLAEHCDVNDVGTNSTDPVDYSDYAQAIGQALRLLRSRAYRCRTLLYSIQVHADESGA
jgi:ribose 5-phosphate isomerase RpiB